MDKKQYQYDGVAWCLRNEIQPLKKVDPNLLLGKVDFAQLFGKLDRGEEPATAKRYREMKKEEFELDEKTLTAAETAKKEQIVKSMKKNLSGFKSRYGERAKEVMYATATKQAKK
jgi:hypothetical protein